MKIRTQFILMLTVVVLLISGAFVFTFFQEQRLSRAMEENRVANEIMEGAFELSYLTNDYLLHPSERASEQWATRYRSVVKLIDPNIFNTQEELAILDLLKDSIIDLRISFLELRNVVENHVAEEIYSQEIKRRLQSESLAISAAMVSMAAQITDIVNLELVNLQRDIAISTSFFAGILFIWIILILLVLLSVVLKPISALEKGVKIIGGGDLTYRVNIKNKNEIGILATNFNSMTKKLEESHTKLRDSENKYKTLTELSTDCIKTLDLDGNLLFINTEGLREHRLDSLEQATKDGWRMEDTIIQEDRDEFIKAFELAKKGEESNIEIRHTEEGSLRKACLETLAPIKNRKGKVVAVFSASVDISKEKEIEHIKNEFILIASHQLRTPLTGIRWVVEHFMKDLSRFSQKDREYLLSVQIASTRLTLLVDQMLNVSRIESGGIGVVPEKVDVVSLVKDVANEFLPVHESRGIITTFDSSDNKIMANTDISAVRNIVQSIISNAIEYTPDKGEISIVLKKEADTFSISISDTGIGIPKDEISKLFKKFVRAKNAQKFKPSGTGLGLFIVKQAVDLLGGRVSVESEEGKGSTFHVNLPLHSKERAGKKRFV